MMEPEVEWELLVAAMASDVGLQQRGNGSFLELSQGQGENPDERQETSLR